MSLYNVAGDDIVVSEKDGKLILDLSKATYDVSIVVCADCGHYVYHSKNMLWGTYKEHNAPEPKQVSKRQLDYLVNNLSPEVMEQLKSILGR
jgi:hypothetical protein